jgi:glyoxylase-like metal-dependent hydrolase (beta-lactamase superfamily II)
MTRSSRWEVLIIRHGTLATTRAAMFRNPDAPDSPQRIDYYLWVIRSPEESILVDTGSSAAAMRERARTVTFPPSEALAELGLDARWAGTVVLTHAHWDHTGHLAALPAAHVVMDRAEYEFWQSPESREPAVRSLADERDLAELERIARGGRLTLLSPDVAGTEIRPGVRLLPAAGHTPGQLMVEVDTAAGPVLLTSDAVHFDEELERRLPFRHMTDVRKAHESYMAIALRERGDFGAHGALVIAGHEPGLLERYPPADGALAGHAALIGHEAAPTASPLEEQAG